MIVRSIRDALKHIRYRIAYLFRRKERYAGLNIILSIMRRMMPVLSAQDIISVQPMTAPTGQIMTLKYRYGPTGDPTGENLMGRWKREFNKLKTAVRTFSLYPFPPKR